MLKPALKAVRLLMRLTMALMLGLCVGLMPVPVVTNPAAAQATEKRSILQLLFGKRTQKVQRQPEVKRKIRKSSARKDATADPAELAKLPDAKHILVVGDFMAKALADGLGVAFSQSPDLVVDQRSNGSSGLVRNDYFDWAAELPAMIDELKPAMVIIMLGANDRQQLKTDGKKEKFRSDIWTATYQQRSQGLVNVVASRKIPVLWVGLPSFQSESMTADAATLNGFYRQAVEKAGGEFVDIWDGFVDENGKFAYSGSDINGQSVRLRGSDGLSLTKAGKRKMAFYVEKPIRHFLGNPGAATFLRLDTPSVAPGADDTHAPVVVVSTPPISLADPELDGASQLLDSQILPKSDGTTPRDRLVLSGDTGQAPEGRVDDYMMPSLAKTP